VGNKMKRGTHIIFFILIYGWQLTDLHRSIIPEKEDLLPFIPVKKRLQPNNLREGIHVSTLITLLNSAP
jgi:hypothetical protein